MSLFLFEYPYHITIETIRLNKLRGVSLLQVCPNHVNNPLEVEVIQYFPHCSGISETG